MDPTSNSDFITFQRNTLDKSPQDVRAYWTPERKKAAIPVIGDAPMSKVMPSADNTPPPPTADRPSTGESR